MFWLAIEIAPLLSTLACGVRRVKSPSDLDTVGKALTLALSTTVSEPVLEVLVSLLSFIRLHQAEVLIQDSLAGIN
ncbi:MAG: hypothetical protein IPN89_10265 [Saprospiraceae bacterium]|nr:hypothetical protein [Saprospiraceae bacterium]